jgi:hypothetical protein
MVDMGSLLAAVGATTAFDFPASFLLEKAT